MTTAQNITAFSPPEGSTSTLPFDPADLVRGIRVRPAQFARMCGASRQAVSQWIKAGKILLYPDGTLDPAVAARRVIEYTDPARMRAKVFRVLSDDAATLRGRINQLEIDLAAAEQRAAYHEKFADDTQFECDTFRALLDARVNDLAVAGSPDLVRAIIGATANEAEAALVARDDGLHAHADAANALDD